MIHKSYKNDISNTQKMQSCDVISNQTEESHQSSRTSDGKLWHWSKSLFEDSGGTDVGLNFSTVLSLEARLVETDLSGESRNMRELRDEASVLCTEIIFRVGEKVGAQHI